MKYYSFSFMLFLILLYVLCSLKWLTAPWMLHTESLSSFCYFHFLKKYIYFFLLYALFDMGNLNRTYTFGSVGFQATCTTWMCLATSPATHDVAIYNSSQKSSSLFLLRVAELSDTASAMLCLDPTSNFTSTSNRTASTTTFTNNTTTTTTTTTTTLLYITYFSFLICTIWTFF